ncbi:6072_t:CDS:2 [Diversispora eburnea]|uniref:6072_t:CDS:1 n=1 Tax=Diversispora eburnea TaxID=1213867 RepID=A0A9N8UVT9_9GLOM|nr:6072_t:CDS:2 [Diversispora eburnea]
MPFFGSTNKITFVGGMTVLISAMMGPGIVTNTLFVDLINITCGIGLYPDFGFVCVHKIGSENSPFGNISFMIMSSIVIIWVVTSIRHGLNFNYVPIIGDDQSQVVGTVLFNYVLTLTISSVVSELEKDVPIRKLVLSSTLIVTIFYLALGIFGALAYKFETSANIISTIHRIETDNEIVQIATYLFPLILIFSMSINAIVIRYNLIRSGICKSVIPFQTGYWLAIFTNWTSIIFICSSNFIIPFWLYILSQKRKLKIMDDFKEIDVKLEKEIAEKKKEATDIFPLKDVTVTTSSSYLSSPQSSLTPTKNVIITFGCFEEMDDMKNDNENLRTLSVRIAWIAT